MNSVFERAKIVGEYFLLRDYMNRANRLSNQATEIKFEIERIGHFGCRLLVVSYSKNEVHHRLSIAERSSDKDWERTGNTGFINLEEYCAQTLSFLERRETQPGKTGPLLDDIMRNLEQELSIRLKNLFLNNSYEP
jgi:hypothetical protein